MSAIRSRAGEIRKAERLTIAAPGAAKAVVNDSASGEIFCSNCGYVIKEKMAELGPEWRHFPRRKNNPPILDLLRV